MRISVLLGPAASAADEVEKAVGEQVEGPRIPLELGAQDRALPADPEEGGEPIAIVVRPDLAGPLSRPQDPGGAPLPIAEDGAELVPEALRQRPHLLAEIAHDAAAPERVARHAGPGLRDEAAQSLQRGSDVVAEGALELAGEIGGLRLDQDRP